MVAIKKVLMLCLLMTSITVRAGNQDDAPWSDDGGSKIQRGFQWEKVLGVACLVGAASFISCKYGESKGFSRGLAQGGHSGIKLMVDSLTDQISENQALLGSQAGFLSNMITTIGASAAAAWEKVLKE